jgi:hypothetical protein
MSSDTLLAIFAIALSVVVFGLLITGAVLVVRDTIRQRGRWGLNLKAPNCRHCQAPMPPVRIPANARQAMWGGWTCKQCGLEVDKWGEPIPDQTRQAKFSTPLVDPRTQALPERRPDERTSKRRDDVQHGGREDA